MANSELDTTLVRNGTFGTVWLDGEEVAEAYGCQAKVHKTKESVKRCHTLVNGSKLTNVNITGSIRIYNATNRLIEMEADAINDGKDLQHTIISSLDDPDNPQGQRISLRGVSFDDLTLADWEAAKMGEIEAPFTASGYSYIR